MMVSVRSAFFIGLLLATSTPCLATPAKKEVATVGEVVIDAVVASVDDKPITLSDLTARLTPPRKLTLDEAAKDQEALKVLDQIIAEKILEEEAKAKRLSVADSEVEDYLSEVAQRNGLSRTDFEGVLAKEGRSLSSYKQQVKFEILRAKLASSITRGGTSITDSEIDEYIASHPDLKHSGVTLKLHHILISKSGKTPEEVQSKVSQITSALDGGESFIAVAKRLSDSAGASEGSLIGVIAPQDLSTEISEAVSSLSTGEHSRPVESENDIQLFYVEERLSAEGDEDSDEKEEALRNGARQILQKQKTKERLASYFGEDLYKNHAIDKRL